MVSGISMLSICITLLITLILPIVLYVLYGVRQKKKEIWIAGALGAAGFVLMQVIIRLSVLSVVSQSPAFMEWAEKNYILYCFILAFTAGLFEVVARYGVAKIMYISKGIAKEITYETGIAAGIGHGGIEAVVLVGATYVNNLIFAVMINSGAWDAVMRGIEDMGDPAVYEVYAAIPGQLTDTAWYMFLLAGYERILTMVAHVAMTMIVFYFVSKKKDLLGVIICLICHTLLDFIFVIISGLGTEYLGNYLTQNMAYVYVYVFLTCAAIASVALLIYIKKKWK